MTLRDEIREQPEVLERFLRSNRVSIVPVAEAIHRHAPSSVLIAARGTSDNAARYAQYLWGWRNRMTVALAAPSLFGVYGTPPSLEGALVVGISQSGQSPDLVAVLEEARRQRRPTLVITNDPGSPLARAGDHVLDLGAGPERSIAATKTYTAELFAVAVLSAALAGDDDMVSVLESVPEGVREVLAQSGQVESVAREYRDIERCVVLGRGFNMATAFEWALKLQELCSVVAHPFSAADFEHGPIAMVEPGFPVLAVLPEGPLRPGLDALVSKLRDQLGARVVMVSSTAEPTGSGAQRIGYPAGTPEWVSPILAIVGAQLFCSHLAVAKGLDPDAPRGLRKVTRTQ